jgi:hypothetical protein
MNAFNLNYYMEALKHKSLSFLEDSRAILVACKHLTPTIYQKTGIKMKFSAGLCYAISFVRSSLPSLKSRDCKENIELVEISCTSTRNQLEL